VANLTALLAQENVTAPFDQATGLAIYVNGNPGPDDAVTRSVERATAQAQITSPYTGETHVLVHYLADRTEMQLLHMTTQDAARTPTFTVFPRPEVAADVAPPSTICDPSGFVCIDNTEVWVHGNVAPEINTTWLGIVGPGVKNLGVHGKVWSDHTDIRPTILALVGLRDDYSHQGRVVSEFFDGRFGVAARGELEDLGRLYKQLNAPAGEFGLATLQAATGAIASGSSSSDSKYLQTMSSLDQLGQSRDQVCARIERVLEAAWFQDEEPDRAEVNQLRKDAEAILQRSRSLAAP